jgi:hypothetical protein
MRRVSRMSVLATFLLLCFAGAASAQIMRITTDNPVDNTALKPFGTTLLTITLDPDTNSSGGYASCDWAYCTLASDACGVETSPGYCGVAGTTPNTVKGYDIVLFAVDGPVTWGTFTPASHALGSQTATDTQIEISYLRQEGTPGPFTIGTLPVTTASPYTHIEIRRWSASQPGTSLIMDGCTGLIYGTLYRLGNLASPCVNGPTDWFDAHGVSAPIDACLTKRNLGQCQVCCLNMGGVPNPCATFCAQIIGPTGEPHP